jgi:hypothetical protein
LSECDQAGPAGQQWVCFDFTGGYSAFAECVDLGTQVPRFCCPAEFDPCGSVAD